MSEQLGVDSAKQAEYGICNPFMADKGQIYFLVKKEELKHSIKLLLYEYNYDAESYETTTVREAYLVKDVEVKQP